MLIREQEEEERERTQSEDEESLNTQPRTKRLRREGAVASLDDLWNDLEEEPTTHQEDDHEEEAGPRDTDADREDEGIADIGDDEAFFFTLLL